MQEVVANCPEPHLLLSIIRWLEENLEHIIVSKPAVFLALAVLDKLAEKSIREQVWAKRLENFISHFIKPEEVGVMLSDTFSSNWNYISVETLDCRRPEPRRLPAGPEDRLQAHPSQ